MTSLLPSLLPQQPQKTEEQAFEERVQRYMYPGATPPFAPDPAYDEAQRRIERQWQGIAPAAANSPTLSGLLRWLTSQQ